VDAGVVYIFQLRKTEAQMMIDDLKYFGHDPG
jgi:hypothetical protein